MTVYRGAIDDSSESTVAGSNVKSEIVLSSARIRQIYESTARDIETRPCGDGPWMQWVTWEVLLQQRFETFRFSFQL